jgi:serine/threonine protein kinase
MDKRKTRSGRFYGGKPPNHLGKVVDQPKLQPIREEKSEINPNAKMCKVIFTYPGKQSYCIVDSTIEKYEKSGKVYIISDDIAIDQVSYSMFKNPSFDSYIAVETNEKAKIMSKEYKVYSLKPLKTKNVQLKDVKKVELEEKVKSPKKIGEGTFGSVVYYPTQNVVVKTSIAKSDELADDIVKEIAIYNLLYKISCIPKLYDFELSKQTKMIFERGISTVKEAYNNFTEKQAKIAMFRILKCMRNIASQGIIHADLKPQNMIISEDGNAQIIDWGLAEIDTSVGQTKEKYSGKQTMYYRAPEICLNEGKMKAVYSNKIDIFSLGMIFLEIYKKNYDYPSENLGNYMYVLLRKFYGYSKESVQGMDKVSKALEKCVSGDKILTYSDIQETLESKDGYGVKDHVFADLIARMVHADPSKRITYDEALLHPYFQSMIRERIPNLPKFVNNMPIIPDLRILWSSDKTGDDFVDFGMRLRLIDWLKDFNAFFKFSPGTLFLGIQLLDYYVLKAKELKVPVSRKKLQLLGCVCISIASKLLEINSLPSEDIERMTDGGFKEKEAQEFEKNAIYKVFKGNLYMPSLWSYTENYFDKKTLPEQKDIYAFYLQKDVYSKDMAEKFKEIIS